MEFGSDFHTFDFPKGGKSLLDFYPDSNLYASGRQALFDLAIARNWKRLWVPSYFCEESLNCINRAGIQLCKYKATPLTDPDTIPELTEANEGDGLLIVNFFGLYKKRDFSNQKCEVIEDHTHNLIGDWAINSTADWCIASLRKTLPIADGGILWSPLKHPLPSQPVSTSSTEEVMLTRFKAMDLKQKYLKGEETDKSLFLSLYRESEEEFDRLPVSRISKRSLQIIENLNINRWYQLKKGNWETLRTNLDNSIHASILVPENTTDTPFSLILFFDDSQTRNNVRSQFINNCIYPAILWQIEDTTEESSKDFGDRMLSIHCDGRYSDSDINILISTLKDILIELYGYHTY